MAKKADTWKKKQSFDIMVPEIMGNYVAGTTITADPKNLMGRCTEISMRDLTENKAKQHLMLKIKIDNTKGDKALTSFKRFRLSRGYFMSISGRGTGKINYIHDIELSDGKKVRVKTVVLTRRSPTNSQRKNVSDSIYNALKNRSDFDLPNFIHYVVDSKMSVEIYRNIRNICPMRRAEIHRVDVL